MTSNLDLIIVGAGAAGIGAAQAAATSKLNYRVLEASHRVGGRGLTEELAPGIPWDLGCHWLHSGSINPLARVADQLGMHYGKGSESRNFFLKGAWVTPQQQKDYADYTTRQWHAMRAAEDEQRDVAVVDLTELDQPWSSYYCYWQSLMSSEDVDQFSFRDLTAYQDTDENWPVTDGYGTLLTKHAAGLPIELNTTVKKIDWSGERIKVTTNRGELTSKYIVITVSTGVLGAGDIEFLPKLPLATREAIDALPLGCYNNFAMLYEQDWPFDADTPSRIDYSNGDDVNFAFKLNCSGWPYIYCAVAGRQARWLERQPPAESESMMMGALKDIFGNDFARKITRFKTSAWGGDPLVKGAYSASKPGLSQQRKVLSEPVADKLFIAGEAASTKAFCTAHGAWETGRDAVKML